MSPATPSLRDRKRARTRQAIINAAVELFERNGYDGTTVADIAAAADIGTRTFFSYFASKEELCLALIEADKIERQPAPLNKLVVGLKCGGSDGFSGISANPAIGHTSDLLVALGGSTILSEFPELCGVEQELINRCEEDEAGNRFIQLMRTYSDAAEAVGSGFDMNPSPGNIKDGLITDAIKSAGAAG